MSKSNYRNQPNPNKHKARSLQVTLFEYSIHWAQGDLTEKIGSCIFFRRSKEGSSILVHMVKTGSIMMAQSDVLSVLLKMNNVAMRKNATRAAKIRQLLKVPSIQNSFGKSDLEALETKIKEMETRRNNKNAATKEGDEPEEENEEEASRL